MQRVLTAAASLGWAGFTDVQRAAVWCSAGTALAGLLVLLGWVAHWPPLYGSFFEGAAASKPITGLALVLSSGCLWLQVRAVTAEASNATRWSWWGALACGSVALALAVEALAFHFGGIESGIASRFYGLLTGATAHGLDVEMSKMASLCLTILAIALLLAGQRQIPALFIQLLSMTILIVCTWAVIEIIIQLGQFTDISVNAAVGYMLLAYGAMLLRPPAWLTNTAFRRGPAARLFAWLPAVVLAPILLAAVLEDTARLNPAFRDSKDELLVLLFVAALVAAFWVGVRVVRTTDQRRLWERRQRRQDQRYRHIVEAARDGILLTSVDGTITYANPSLEAMLGYESGELPGHNSVELVPTEHAAEVRETIARSHDLVRQDFERELRRKDGGTLIALITVTALNDDKGQQLGRLSMITDITSLKQAEAERRRLEAEVHQAQLEGVRKAVATYMHELNSPLTGLINCVDMLLENCPPEDEDRIWLVEMQEACHRMAKVLRRMQEIKELRPGAAGGKRGPLDLRADLDSAATLAKA